MSRNRKKLSDVLHSVTAEIRSKTVVEFHSSGVMYISGCEKIMEYTENNIELKCYDMKVTFNGEKLKLQNLINGQISITGRIITVNFIYL